MDELLKILLTNIKNHPWHLYPDFKIDEATGKALAEELARPHRIFGAELNEDVDDGK